MLQLVTGGSGSGKSAYAEKLAMEQCAGRKFYIATMKPWDEECLRRIEKHRNMRADKHFETLEVYGRLNQLCLPEDSVVLLECLSNLAANVFFSGEFREDEFVSMVSGDILGLKNQVKSLIIVANDVFSDGLAYDKETEAYRRMLAGVGNVLAGYADSLIEVVYGIPVEIRSGV